MSRLLHAAARGARVQYYDAPPRIHPDDAYLQYGPISTALRKRALTGEIQTTTLPYIKGGLVLTHEESLTFAYDKTFDVIFFLLLVAEALADEGL